MKKYIAIAIAALTIAATAAPATAQQAPVEPMVIGMFDAGSFSNAPRGIELEKVGGVAAPTSFDHSKYVLAAFNRGYRAKKNDTLRILYASPFEVDPDAKNPNEVILDWNTMFKAMVEMKKRGVTLICTTFGSDDSFGAEKMVKFAGDLGMTVVASLGNGETTTPYPAMMPGVIAVLGSEANVDRSVRKRADYTISGQIDDVRGSSFAAAEVCGRMARQQSSGTAYASR